MQKFIRISAIVAAALVAVSVFLLLVSIPLQGLLVQINNYPESAQAALPIFPTIPLMICLMQLGCMIPMIFASSQRGGIWLEILLFVIMAVAIPSTSSAMSTMQAVLFGQMGSNLVAANSFISPLIKLCTNPAGLGQCIAYAVCGMRLISKLVHKNQINY